MSRNFFVFNFRKMVKWFILIIVILILIFVLINKISGVVETSASNRLLPIYSVEKIDKCVSLTFDCAWGADDIESIINTLTENDIIATFFTVGDFVEKNPNEVKALYDAGMEIGNHSYSHAHVNKMSYEQVVADTEKCNARIEEITGEKVKYYRGPYGEYNNTVISAIESLGMKAIQWDVDTLDYKGKTANEMCERIKKKIRNGSIILMHNDTEHTAEGLQQIIDTIKDGGYEIVSLSDLIYLDNYSINNEGRQILNK